MKQAARWMRNHKLRTLFLAIGIFILYVLLTTPYFSIASLRRDNPTKTALMQQRLDEAEDEGKTLKISHKWISLSQLAKHTTDAIIVAEDGTFYSHRGIDWFEVRESIEKNLAKGRIARGASTITQQLAKNLYLSTSKDPLRKLREVLITILLEQMLTKNRILELYVNVIEWGNGIFGIEAASQRYFGKSASNLTLDEATRLAAVIPSPLRHRPDGNGRYVMRRKQVVLRRMEARKFAGQTFLKEMSPSDVDGDTEDVDSVNVSDTTNGNKEPSEFEVPDTVDMNEERNGL